MSLAEPGQFFPRLRQGVIWVIEAKVASGYTRETIAAGALSKSGDVVYKGWESRFLVGLGFVH